MIWLDGIVPITMKLIWLDLDPSHLLIGDFLGFWIVFTIKHASHPQAGSSLGGSDEVDNGCMSQQWLSSPVLGDE